MVSNNDSQILSYTYLWINKSYQNEIAIFETEKHLIFGYWVKKSVKYSTETCDTV